MYFAKVKPYFQCTMSKAVIVTLLSTTVLLSYFVQVSNAQDRVYNAKKFMETIRIENTELNEWKAPEELKKSISYYFGGYDFEERPVWFLEFGKWDLRKLFTGTGSTAANDEKVRLYEKYTDQLFYRFTNSPKLWPKNPENSMADEWVFVVDLDGYDFRQLASPEVIRQTLKLARALEIAGKNMASCIVLNTNYVGQTLLNLVKPVLGSAFNNFEIYGSNKEKWIPQLLRRIPKDNLPEWYGGSQNYTPIAVYG